MPESVFTHDRRSTVRISAETTGLQALRTQKDLTPCTRYVFHLSFFY